MHAVLEYYYSENESKKSLQYTVCLQNSVIFWENFFLYELCGQVYTHYLSEALSRVEGEEVVLSLHVFKKREQIIKWQP